MSFLLITGFALPACALPTDYEVEHGAVTDRHTEHDIHFHIESDQAILNFRELDIAPSEAVEFHHHHLTDTSRTLGRVTGGEVSDIAGKMSANAPLFLVNPAGIHVAATAVIDVQRGLVLSTLDIANEDFLAGNFRFEQVAGRLPASLLNQGKILTRPGEIVALLGGSVENTGLLLAEIGSVALAAGEQVTLSFDKEGWLGVAVDAPLTQVAQGVNGRPAASAIEQSGQILAPGGYVLVHARAVEGLFNRLVNLPAGVIEAVSVVEHVGRVELVGVGGLVANGGRISVDGTAAAPDAGKILVNATRILQEGRVTSNAAEGGQAGEISVISQDETMLAPGSRLEAKASGSSGRGGSIWVRSSQPKLGGSVLFQGGSVMDVSGGSLAGDAGNVELSAQRVRFEGKAYAQAQEGYWGGLLLVDPLFLILNTTVNPAPPDNATGTPDVAHSDAPVGGTTTLEISDIVGFAEAFFQAILDITVNAPLVMNNHKDLRMEAGRNLIVNANVQVKGNGEMTLIADADFSGNGGAASDGVGTIMQAVGAQILSGKGTLTLETGADFTIQGLIKGSGEVHITSRTGNILEDGNSATFVQAKDLFLTANAAGMGVGTGGLLDVDLSGELTLDVGSGGAAVRDRGDSFTLVSTVVAPNGALAIRADKTLHVEGAHAVTGAGTISLRADADGDGDGAVKMDGGSSLSSEGGDINLRNAGKMDLRTITSSTGEICVHSWDDINVKGTISTGGAGRITLWADSEGDGEGTVKQDGSVSDITTDAGQILLWGAKGTKIKDLTSTSGNIFVWLTNANANLALEGLISTGGNVELFAGADVKDENGAATNVIAGGDAEFISLNGRIGSSSNAMEVDIDGALDVAAGGMQDGVSVNISGSVGGGVLGGPAPNPPHLVTELGIPVTGPVPPGEVLLGVPQVLAGPLGAGFDANTTCITGGGGGDGGGGGGGDGDGPALILPVSSPAALLDFLFQVQNRRRYRVL